MRVCVLSICLYNVYWYENLYSCSVVLPVLQGLALWLYPFEQSPALLSFLKLFGGDWDFDWAFTKSSPPVIPKEETRTGRVSQSQP